MRWHVIQQEHLWRQAVLDRLDRLIEVLEGEGANEPAPSTFSCPRCGKSGFKSQQALGGHMGKCKGSGQ